jgi:hypothetical protein
MRVRRIQRTLELRLAQRRGVASNENELGLAAPETLQSGLVAENNLARLHNQRKLAVDAVRIGLGPGEKWSVVVLEPVVKPKPPRGRSHRVIYALEGNRNGEHTSWGPL